MKPCHKCGTGECVCKRKFHVNDRIRIYTECDIFTDTIGKILPDGYLETGMGIFHSKQCRRIKRRAPKEPEPDQLAEANELIHRLTWYADCLIMRIEDRSGLNYKTLTDGRYYLRKLKEKP